jgi:predicted transcriptional regulator
MKEKNMQTNDLLPLETIQRKLEDRRLPLVAKRAGLSHPTVKRVADGDLNITLNTWRALSEYFRED